MAELSEAVVRTVIREEIAGLKTEVSHTNVMFEALDRKMDAVAELVSTTVATRNDVVELKGRVDHLESDVAVIKLAIRS